MTVFALMLATDYEGEMLLGVYSSRELAEGHAEVFATDQRSGKLYRSESFEIRETDLDGIAQYHW